MNSSLNERYLHEPTKQEVGMDVRNVSQFSVSYDKRIFYLIPVVNAACWSFSAVDQPRLRPPCV